MPAPNIVPGISGDLQIEWHTEDGDIELDVRAPNEVHAWRETPETGSEGQELSLSNDFTKVAAWLKRLLESTSATIGAAA
jgi:hypothetical protein